MECHVLPVCDHRDRYSGNIWSAACVGVKRRNASESGKIPEMDDAVSRLAGGAGAFFWVALYRLGSTPIRRCCALLRDLDDLYPYNTMKNSPNKAPLPIRPSVTPRAGARVAPAALLAGL